MKRKSEEKLQSDCYIWFNNTYCLKNHNPRLAMMLVPNEVAMKVRGLLISEGVNPRIISKVIGIMHDSMKSTGLLDGASDNIIIGHEKVAFVEFKIGNNTQQSNQKDFESRVTKLGHDYVVIRSLKEFQEYCEKFVSL